MAGFTRQDHERGLAQFVAAPHRRRFLDALDDARLRRKLGDKLAHFAWLDERYVEIVRTPDPGELARQLQAEGAPEHCALVASHNLDGCVMALADALGAVLHEDEAALISCVPGRLAVYSGEAPNGQTHVLRRQT